MKLVTLLKEKAKEAIEEAFLSELDTPVSDPDIAPCQQEQFGHYQCNNALRLSKLLKQSPKDVAQKIVDQLNQHSKNGKLFDKIQIAGPGFINFFFSAEFLSREVDQLLRDPLLGVVRPQVKDRIIVEFSSPNIAKELHVGHLRSTIIGECLARLFEFLGYDVLRLNHVGDWGTQFGMLIAYMKEFESEVLRNEKQMDLSSLMHMYKQAKKRFDENEEFKKTSQLEVVKLQARDEEAIHVWEKICKISRLAFQEIYDLLDVEINERGESFYSPYLKEVVEDLEKKGLIEISDGAKCVFLEGFKTKDGTPLPLIVQKSDGGFNYATTDLAALKHRVVAEKAKRIVIVTDQGQSLHFQMVFKAAEKAGFYDPKEVEINHVGFGLVLGPDGKKFKTRSGETEKLIDLIHKAIDQSKHLIKEKISSINEQELNYLAQNLGIAAVKYADLSSQRQKDYTFSYDRMLRFEGNTAIFLLYAYVRIMGIKRRVKTNIEKIAETHSIQLKHPSEITLGLHLLRFSEVLEQVTRDLLPNRLADYLYELANKFNAFFRDCRVEGSDEMESRLLLCEAAAKVLKQGLYLLGIKTVERM